jgi:hypothetical protein
MVFVNALERGLGLHWNPVMLWFGKLQRNRKLLQRKHPLTMLLSFVQECDVPVMIGKLTSSSAHMNYVLLKV